MASLPAVRRFEAAGFRAWPASTVTYEGSWLRRLSPGHPTRRPNCVVPLDPGDIRDLEGRVRLAEAAFGDAGVPLVIKETPLCPRPLVEWLAAEGWVSESECSVQTLTLDEALPPAGIDLIPTHDISVFLDACTKVEGNGRTPRDAMERLFASIQPETGMFILGDAHAHPKAVTLCVRDGDLAGLQQVAVSQAERRQGLGFEITAAALRWARMRGAHTAWLQVEAQNAPAMALYRKFGFTEIYRYRYWRKGT